MATDEPADHGSCREAGHPSLGESSNGLPTSRWWPKNWDSRLVGISGLARVVALVGVARADPAVAVGIRCRSRSAAWGRTDPSTSRPAPCQDTFQCFAAIRRARKAGRVSMFRGDKAEDGRRRRRSASVDLRVSARLARAEESDLTPARLPKSAQTGRRFVAELRHAASYRR
jgi:hypothetical protein